MLERVGNIMGILGVGNVLGAVVIFIWCLVTNMPWFPYGSLQVPYFSSSTYISGIAIGFNVLLGFELGLLVLFSVFVCILFLSGQLKRLKT